MHSSLLHSGRNRLLAKLREQYWLIHALSAIRKIISKCVSCRRHMSKIQEQKMASLPKDRIIPDEPPFSRVGEDYFGPFEVKVKRSRVKRYGVIFTCLAIRAVYLEVAASLDTDSYINALRLLSQKEDKLRGSASTMGRTSLVPNVKLLDPFWNGTNFKFSQPCYRLEVYPARRISSRRSLGKDYQINP